MNAVPDHIPFDQDPLGGVRPGGTHLRWSPDDEWHDGDGVDYDDDDRCYCHVEEQPGAEKLLGLYHEKAASVQNAVFMFGSMTPAKTKGASDSAWIAQRFKIGDVAKMAAEARDRGAHSNVYFGPAVMRSDLPKGQRGKEADIVAVCSVVIEEDADTGKMVTLPPGVEPSFVVVSSSDPTINRHFHFVFDKPLPPAEAKKLAELAHRKCGGDHGGKDITHVWRIPETLNFPCWRKIERGRPETPQLVELIGGGTGNAIDVDLLRSALEAMPDRHKKAEAGADAGWTSGGSKDRDAILARLKPTLRAKIDLEGKDRSAYCFTVMMGLFDAGLTDDEVCVVAAGAVFASKFSERGDLEAEIKRARWQASQNSAGADGAFECTKNGEILKTKANFCHALNLEGITLQYDAFAWRSMSSACRATAPTSTTLRGTHCGTAFWNSTT